MQPHELARASDLTLAAYRGVAAPGPLGPGSPSGRLSEDYTTELANVADRAARAIVLVAVEDGEVLGAVTFVPGLGPYAEFDDAQAAGMRMLAVVPGAQGRGIGGALVRECLRQARERGRTRLVLHTTSWMRAARRLYEHMGFRREPGLDWEPAPRVELIGYAYDLKDEPGP